MYVCLESEYGNGGKDVEKLFEEIVVNIFPNLMKISVKPRQYK